MLVFEPNEVLREAAASRRRGTQRGYAPPSTTGRTRWHFEKGGHRLKRKATDSIAIWQFELLSRCERLVHGVTGRYGGVSEGSYAQLNLGLHVGDDSERVVENRGRVSRALGVDFEKCTFAQQVHGDAIRLVADDELGAGRERFEEAVPETDGLVVSRPGVTITVLVADCVSLLVYDPERHVGAAVHAGWRGTAEAIAAKAVRVLEEECGSRPDALLVGVGPAIGSCCYGVSADVVKALEEGSGCEEPLAQQREGRWYVDLVRANRGQLVAAGIRPENIEAAGICTACQAEEFYSERKLGRPTGRFGAFLCLR